MSSDLEAEEREAQFFGSNGLNYYGPRQDIYRLHRGTYDALEAMQKRNAATIRNIQAEVSAGGDQLGYFAALGVKMGRARKAKKAARATARKLSGASAPASTGGGVFALVVYVLLGLGIWYVWENWSHF